MRYLKRILIFISAISFTTSLFARFTAKCDVVYEKSIGEWSDYERMDVEFVSGNELGGKYYGNDLYAIVWYSQTNCAIIKMEYNSIMLNGVDKDYIYYFLMFDILNEGRPGVQVNSEKEIKWRIYGKDESFILIDQNYNVYPYNSYIEDAKRNVRDGVVEGRLRPAEEREYAGLDKGTIRKRYNKDCYIIETKYNCIVALRNTLYYFTGLLNEGDVVFGHFSKVGETDMKNGTQGGYGPKIKVAYVGSNYSTCVDWVEENVAIE